MPDCNAELFHFPSFDRRKIEADFSGGDVSSDGGVMLLRQADRRLGLTRALDASLTRLGVDTIDLLHRQGIESLIARDSSATYDYNTKTILAGNDGTGILGLSDRVEALGGRFAVESPPGRGTTISVELPIATPATP